MTELKQTHKNQRSQPSSLPLSCSSHSHSLSLLLPGSSCLEFCSHRPLQLGLIVALDLRVYSPRDSLALDPSRCYWLSETDTT
ncbi:hypothetical protein RRG08_022887 [Elysia crispata]|uniref:Uncharacterized protein n=1 Tax=Elysia crispata TaxID=231223 RepID=A0AAE1CJ56_9GAST|nr:hypothetical protein RRG08_022887 [Elysia crispata]